MLFAIFLVYIFQNDFTEYHHCQIVWIRNKGNVLLSGSWFKMFAKDIIRRKKLPLVGESVKVSIDWIQ